MKSALLGIAVCIITFLLIGELGARLFLPPPTIVSVTGVSGVPVSMKSIDGAKSNDIPISSVFMSTPYGVRMRPGVSVNLSFGEETPKNILFRTNSLGLRGPEIENDKRERVVFLGDSITLADSVSEEETFVSQFESLARHSLQAINAGISTLGLSQEIYLFQEIASHVEPKDVVLMFYLNDAVPSPSFRSINPPDFVSFSSFLTYLYRLPAWLNSTFLISSKEASLWMLEASNHLDFIEREDAGKKKFVQEAKGALGDWGNAWSEKVWGFFESDIERLKVLAEKSGTRLSVVILPVRSQFVDSNADKYPQQMMGRVGEKLGIQVIDPLSIFRQASSEGISLTFDHCHLTPKGHRILAEYLFANLVLAK